MRWANDDGIIDQTISIETAFQIISKHTKKNSENVTPNDCKNAKVTNLLTGYYHRDGERNHRKTEVWVQLQVKGFNKQQKGHKQNKLRQQVNVSPE